MRFLNVAITQADLENFINKDINKMVYHYCREKEVYDAV